jgi:hypothetical protein
MTILFNGQENKKASAVSVIELALRVKKKKG